MRIFDLARQQIDLTAKTTAKIREQSEELATLRAEVERLRGEYAGLKQCHDVHYRDFLSVAEKNERLRGLLQEHIEWLPYVTATLDTAKNQRQYYGPHWASVHVGRACSSIRGLDAFLERARAALEEDR